MAVLNIIISKIQKPVGAEAFSFGFGFFKQSRLGRERLALQRDLHIAHKIADRIVIHLDCFSAWVGAANG